MLVSKTVECYPQCLLFVKSRPFELLLLTLTCSQLNVKSLTDCSVGSQTEENYSHSKTSNA